MKPSVNRKNAVQPTPCKTPGCKGHAKDGMFGSGYCFVCEVRSEQTGKTPEDARAELEALPSAKKCSKCGVNMRYAADICPYRLRKGTMHDPDQAMACRDIGPGADPSKHPQVIAREEQKRKALELKWS